MSEAAAECLGHGTTNPEVAGSSLTLTTKLDLFLGRPLVQLLHRAGE